MADTPAMPSSPPASAGNGDPSSPSVPVPRVLPSTMLLDNPPPSSGRARGPRGGRAAAASGSGGRGGGRGTKSTLTVATSYGTDGRKPDRLVEAVKKVPTDVDAGLASADILQLALAKGPMFEWLSYWPEKGFRKEDHPY
ncbi:hypothetical protein BDA96_01G242000 [Sorghum bicolor]|uniref:Uncharacterized protein n=1 Tax=Sorghum bicolor TaxID=4558 RepID=A0A921S0Y0_SORBI|nr:hypothetical protein BDA96_01G242000 [Sorghum bicolor]